jgi:hypothetical protein
MARHRGVDRSGSQAPTKPPGIVDFEMDDHD